MPTLFATTTEGRYHKSTTVITYGTTLLERTPVPDLTAYGLSDVQPGRFFLYVSRLEPENQASLVIRAYRSVPGSVPLLVVGDAPHADAYKAQLRRLASLDARVRLTGGIYGEGYRDLQRSALAYIHATSVGGTHPALVEAMGAGNVVLAFDTPENREVLGGVGTIFGTSQELTDSLTRMLANQDVHVLDAQREAARSRAALHYSWDAVTDAYLDLWRKLGA